MDQEELFKYIDLLQSCISRMAKDSFMVKGWAASFIVAVVVLLLKNNAPWYFILLLAVPIVVFWKLDAFFLRTEKCYRLMYECLIGVKDKPVGWKLYDLNPINYSNHLVKKDDKGNETVVSEFDVMLSKTLWPFYVIPIVVILLLGFEKYVRCNKLANISSGTSSTLQSVEFHSEDNGFNYKFERTTKTGNK